MPTHDLPAPQVNVDSGPRSTDYTQKDLPSPVKRLSNVVDKLSRSVASGSGAALSPLTPPSRRVFTIGRRSKPSQLSADSERATEARAPPGDASQSISVTPRPDLPNGTESPFIQPPSPPLRPSLLDSFQGDGSVRILLLISCPSS